MQRKLLIIGIDGATYSIIDPLLRAGELPNLNELIGNGSKTKLLSTIHPMSPQAWTSFHTGVSPWKHGIVDFFSLDIGQPLSPIRWHDIQAVSIAELIDRIGIRTIWSNLMGTYPFPKLGNGIIVGGRMTPAKGAFIYPAYLQREVHQLFPEGYEMHIDLSRLAVDGKIPETAVLTRLLSHTEHQTQLTAHLMKTQSWDLCFVMFDSTDIGQHIFWQYLDDKHPNYDDDAPDVLKQAIPTIYRKVDDSIGKLLQVAPKDTNVLVLSDHGFGPLYATVNLNGFLKSANYTTPMRRIHPKRLRRGIANRLRGYLGTGKNKRPIYQSLNLNWKKTAVYAYGCMGNIFINLKDREPEGCISPNDYERVIRDLVDDLKRWPNPVSGFPMIKAIHSSEMSISKRLQTRGIPDFLIEWFDYRYAGIHPGSFDTDFELSNPPFSYNLLRSADHNLEGILIASGPDFRLLSNDPDVGAISICRMAPLIMFLMGLSLPAHFDGNVPLSLLQPKVNRESPRDQSIPLARRVSSGKSGRSEPEESEIVTRLKQLGYLQ